MREHLGLHESLELHELLTLKSLSLTKSTIIQAFVTDPELKTIMQQYTSRANRHIETLKNQIQ
ncbi:hypothetical protein GMB86_10280 [Terrilactibacillus sp. BCM23-1]|uniref:Spore coat protein n=1 Tax=Terrilactibacillus tamarindi TaxID=2599694 RepID=A0A6N8CQH4_9BACI|nr:hypothetical protein [Terrilactibacillus tamarindi]MTT32392.1 hypothetical protein [Terrilactibacillus tamarindi]